MFIYTLESIPCNIKIEYRSHSFTDFPFHFLRVYCVCIIRAPFNTVIFLVRDLQELVMFS